MYTEGMSNSTHGEDAPIEVGVRALRADLRGWLNVARARDVVITDRGRPVARLVPIDGYPGIERLVASGEITPPSRAAASSAGWRPVRAEGSVSDLVPEQRA